MISKWASVDDIRQFYTCVASRQWIHKIIQHTIQTNWAYADQNHKKQQEIKYLRRK